jgi:hypothetical protein
MKKTITTCDIENCGNETNENRVIFIDGVQKDICEDCLARLFNGKNKVPSPSLSEWIYPWKGPFYYGYNYPWQRYDNTTFPPTTITWNTTENKDE